MQATVSVSDVATLAGAAAALVAAIGGVSAAFLGVREYTLKSTAQRVEIDVQLSKLLAEMVPIANGRGEAIVSDAAAEIVAQHQVGERATPKEMGDALEGAVITLPVGEATQAAAITSIGYLGGEHPALHAPALQALLALDFVDGHSHLASARQAALEMVQASRH